MRLLKVVSKKYNDKDVLEVENFDSETVESLKGKDISIEGLTSKGIANTGNIGNIGDVAITGELSVIGEAKIFETIVDENNHKRFVDGNLTLVPIEGVSITYGKWSLSGTHLMIVLAGNIANGTIIGSGNNLFATVDCPQWIKDKLVIMEGTSIARLLFSAYDSGNLSQNGTAVLGKSGSDIQLLWSSFTATADRNFRIVFDLLVDNESEA